MASRYTDMLKKLDEHEELRTKLAAAKELARRLLHQDRTRGYPTAGEWLALIDFAKRTDED